MLLDVRMSGMDGWQVLHRLRTAPDNFPDLPVVVFTADMSSVDNAPVDLRERDFFLPKPFSSHQLIRAIDSALR
jgi:CheY-like chemotaxis protein